MERMTKPRTCWNKNFKVSLVQAVYQANGGPHYESLQGDQEIKSRILPASYRHHVPRKLKNYKR